MEPSSGSRGVRLSSSPSTNATENPATEHSADRRPCHSHASLTLELAGGHGLGTVRPRTAVICARRYSPLRPAHRHPDELHLGQADVLAPSLLHTASARTARSKTTTAGRPRARRASP